jgi:hypothetical protein
LFARIDVFPRIKGCDNSSDDIGKDVRAVFNGRCLTFGFILLHCCLNIRSEANHRARTALFGRAVRVVIICSMNPKQPITFDEGSQTFSCDQYYANNFVAFLEANAMRVNTPREIGTTASPTKGKRLPLRLTDDSPRLDQKLGDAFISRFLAADDQIKRRKA